MPGNDAVFHPPNGRPSPKSVFRAHGSESEREKALAAKKKSTVSPTQQGGNLYLVYESASTFYVIEDKMAHTEGKWVHTASPSTSLKTVD